MQTELQKFSSQANPAILSEMKEIARKTGRQFQHVLEEAMVEYVATRDGNRVRPEVMAHFYASIDKHKQLYTLLAK
jgi:geranylgeranyl pyrophosphate synthase